MSIFDKKSTNPADPPGTPLVDKPKKAVDLKTAITVLLTAGLAWVSQWAVDNGYINPDPNGDPPVVVPDEPDEPDTPPVVPDEPDEPDTPPVVPDEPDEPELPNPDPVANIEGPQEAEIGDLVKLIGGDSIGLRFRWIVEDLVPAQYYVDECENTLVFCVKSIPGEYRFRLLATSVAEDGTPTLDEVMHTVQVGKSAPPVPPEPPKEPDDPDDDPDLPAGQYGFAELAFQAVFDEVEKPYRKYADDVQEAFQASVDDDSITTPQEFVDATLVRIREALGATVTPEWAPWYDQQRRHMDELHRNGELTTLEQYHDAWKEIILGLKAHN